MTLSAQRWGELAVVETEDAVFVAAADDPDDWVVCFHKGAEFAAHDWAERMVGLHNGSYPQPTIPFGPLSNYTPSIDR